jgi:hypothetical protein
MKTHLARNDCSRSADLLRLLENKQSYRPHFVCALWTSAIHRDVRPGMEVVVVAAAAVIPQSSVRQYLQLLACASAIGLNRSGPQRGQPIRKYNWPLATNRRHEARACSYRRFSM